MLTFVRYAAAVVASASLLIVAVVAQQTPGMPPGGGGAGGGGGGAGGGGAQGGPIDYTGDQLCTLSYLPVLPAPQLQDGATLWTNFVPIAPASQYLLSDNRQSIFLWNSSGVARIASRASIGEGQSAADGDAATATVHALQTFESPTFIAFGTPGVTGAKTSVVFADVGAIRWYDVSSRTMQTLAGPNNATTGGVVDGVGSAARFSRFIGAIVVYPTMVSSAPTAVFIADTENNCIRRLTVATYAVASVLGSCVGPSSTSALSQPRFMALFDIPSQEGVGGATERSPLFILESDSGQLVETEADPAAVWLNAPTTKASWFATTAITHIPGGVGRAINTSIMPPPVASGTPQEEVSACSFMGTVFSSRLILWLKANSDWGLSLCGSVTNTPAGGNGTVTTSSVTGMVPIANGEWDVFIPRAEQPVLRMANCQLDGTTAAAGGGAAGPSPPGPPPGGLETPAPASGSGTGTGGTAADSGGDSSSLDSNVLIVIVVVAILVIVLLGAVVGLIVICAKKRGGDGGDDGGKKRRRRRYDDDDSDASYDDDEGNTNGSRRSRRQQGRRRDSYDTEPYGPTGDRNINYRNTDAAFGEQMQPAPGSPVRQPIVIQHPPYDPRLHSDAPPSTTQTEVAASLRHTSVSAVQQQQQEEDGASSSVEGHRKPPSSFVGGGSLLSGGGGSAALSATTQVTGDERARHTARQAFIRDKRYTKGKLLGRGASGTVYAGILADGSSIAIKEVKLTGSNLDEMYDQVAGVKKEMDLLSRLCHRHLVAYYGANVEAADANLYIFMELVTGGSLGAQIRSLDSRLSENVARRYLIQALSGLAYLHRKGVVHRDLKGDNVLVSSDTGIVKIADFGTAKNLGTGSNASKAAQTMVGTPYFMAPEILIGSDDVEGYGTKADIWSFGIMTLELLNKGNPPWPQFNTTGQAFLHIASPKGIPIIPEDLSPNCQDFIRKCTHREPRQRWSAERLFEHPWLEGYKLTLSQLAGGDDEEDDGSSSVERAGPPSSAAPKDD